MKEINDGIEVVYCVVIYREDIFIINLQFEKKKKENVKFCYQNCKGQSFSFNSVIELDLIVDF